MNHQKHLKSLLTELLKIGIETRNQMEIFSGYMGNWIPEPEAPRVFKEIGLNFSGKEKNFYFHSFFELRNDKQTEYLKDRELNERLSAFVKKTIFDDRMESSRNLRNKIENFLGEIIKPLEKYEILFKIHNLDAKIEEEVIFWDCKIARYDADALVKWGFSQDDNNLYSYSDFEDKNVFVVYEEGNNVSEVVARARKKASRRLRALQNYLKLEFIYDFQLRFELSYEYAARDIATAQIVITGSDNRNAPARYDYADTLKEYSENANEDYQSIKKLAPPLQDLLDRTLYWIGLSISEIELDLKIAYLCTALETLLSTKDDGRKGEKLAYRGFLLAEEMDPNAFYNLPHRILKVYGLRSSIVHGSKLDITTSNDYWMLLQFTKHTYRNLIKFASFHSLTKQSKIYKKLLESEHLGSLIDWLKKINDQPSNDILVSIEEDQGKKLLP